MTAIDHLSSLLEQCLLYNNPKYTPFSHNANSLEIATNSGGQSTAKSDKNKESITAPVAKKILPNLLCIDLDFSTPITSPTSVIQSVTPLARSTSRRVWHGKIHTHGPRPIFHSYARIRKKAKSKKSTKPSVIEPLNSRQLTKASDVQFLLLPAEIRELIYMSLFGGARLCINQRPSSRHAFDLHLAIRSTCKQIQGETLAALNKCLTIIVYCDNMGSKFLKPWRNMIPDVNLAQLETLIIVPMLARLPFESIKLADMPCLRKLKVVEFDVEYQTEYFALEEITEHAMTKSKSVVEDFQKREDVIELANRSVIFQYDIEIRRCLTEQRSAHMGSLKREHCQFLTVSCTSDNPEVTTSNETTIDQYQDRCEMFQWMENDGIRLPGSGQGHNALRLLERVRYHGALDKMEAGIAKSSRIAKESETQKTAQTHLTEVGDHTD